MEKHCWRLGVTAGNSIFLPRGLCKLCIKGCKSCRFIVNSVYRLEKQIIFIFTTVVKKLDSKIFGPQQVDN